MILKEPSATMDGSYITTCYLSPLFFIANDGENELALI